MRFAVWSAAMPPEPYTYSATQMRDRFGDPKGDWLN